MTKTRFLLMIAVVALGCAAQVLAGVPQTYNQTVYPQPNPVRIPVTWGPNYYLAFVDPNSYSNPTFTLLSAPTNGFLEYRSDLCNGVWLPVPLNTPISNSTVNFPLMNQCATFNNCKWSYTCTNSAMAAIGSTDTFTWRMANNAGTSVNFGGGVATCTISITNNRPPVAGNFYRSCAPGTDTTFSVEFYDPDAQTWNSGYPCGQIWSATVVTPPQYGRISATNGILFTYTATPGSTSKWDTFTYKLNDSVEDSNVATVTLQIRDPSDRAGNLIVLVVNDTLLQPSSLSNEVYRLRDDLVREGYSAKIKSWHNAGSVPSNLWSYLVSEYTNTAQFLAGSILIGELPRASLTNSTGITFYTDFVYWNLQYFQTSNSLPGGYPRNIWVSRIIAPDTTYGSEVTLLRRALDANHDYRTGASRLPHKAFLYETAMKSLGAEGTNAVERMKGVWPEAECRGGPSGTNKWFLTDRPELRLYYSTDGSYYDGVGADCMVAGGDWFEEVSDGLQGGLLFGDGLITTSGLFYYINQVRFHAYMSCDDGVYGGYANSTLLTRGGGCVFTLGFTHTAGNGSPQISDCSLDDTRFRDLLKSHESLGTAAVQYFAFNSPNNPIAMFYGDMSMGVMAAPSNTLPVITSFTNSTPPGHSPVIVNFSVSADDPDGTVSNIEWFLTGYDYGRANPTFSGTVSSVSYAYPAPGVYTARVEVVDNYKARTWREAVVVVNSSPTCTLTVVKSGSGGSSIGSGATASRMIPVGTSTQIVYTADDWYRIDSVYSNGVHAGAAAGMKIYTQSLTSVASDISNAVVFGAATAVQTGITNVPTAWLTNWLESSIVPDAGFDVHDKYLLGLDPTTSNTYTLAIESCTVAGSNVITVLKRTYTGGLSPDGMHGSLELQASDDLVSGFTNVAGMAVTGATVFDGTGRKIYTNSIGTSSRYLRCVIQ